MFKYIKLAILFFILASNITFTHNSFSNINYIFAHSVYADESGGASNSDENGGASNSSISVKLANPLGNGIDNIPDLVRALLDIVLTVGVPLIALAIIYSGYLFVAAQGNPEALKKAKSTLVYVVIGAAILLAAYAISEAIVGSIEAIRG